MVLSMNCNGCVVDETVDSSGASAVRKMVSFSTKCKRLCVRRLVVLYACDFQLVLSTLPAVGYALSPAAGPLFPEMVALFTRCGSALFTRCFDHASRRPWTSAFFLWLLVSGSSRSCFPSLLPSPKHSSSVLLRAA